MTRITDAVSNHVESRLFRRGCALSVVTGEKGFAQFHRSSVSPAHRAMRHYPYQLAGYRPTPSVAFQTIDPRSPSQALGRRS
ncbi:hypothetical protein [Lysobacter sp. cf310]|uniref:hypothetical protein n=1 Tax=Lysobacter sp. cf310 TaxID=1761790 RepID=UPI0011139AA5|nr:hypothetical protein [Lysobacter sp. cf310]